MAGLATLFALCGGDFPLYRELRAAVKQETFKLSLRKAHMNANISLILTTAVSISTIIYTFYSIQLWRTTHGAAEISRQAALSNLWAELNRYLEILRQQNAPEAAFLEKLSHLFLEFMITNLFTQAAKKNDQSMTEFRRRISELVVENEADASKFPWITKFTGAPGV